MTAEILRRAAAKIRDQWSDESDRGRFNLAVADWLDHQAAQLGWGWSGVPVEEHTTKALAVARAYLGEDQ